MSSNVKILKFMTGEEIIAFVSDEAEYMVLSSPARIFHAGQGKIGLMPYPPYGKMRQDIRVRSQFIAFAVEPDEELANEYTNDFVPRLSGLVVPDKKVKTLKLAGD